jgi:hypothetical protein
MWPAALHLFDVNKKMLLGTFRGYQVMPSGIAWSRSSRYLAVATAGAASSLGIWEARTGELNFADSPSSELGAPAWIERQTYEAEFGEEGAFRGYGRTTFSPDERWLSSVVEFQGEWADDSIAFVDVPAMGQQQSHPAHGHITDLSWTHDSVAMLYCAAGAAYRVPLDSMEAQELPFGAELCACHPHLPLCVCFSSWLKNSAKGRLFLVDLQHMTVFDEYAADGVADLCWSADGTKAYAVTRDGRAFIYEPAIL